MEITNLQLEPNNNRPFIQTKLKIGQPEDKYEKEADSVADQVMRRPNVGYMQMQENVNAQQISMKCAHCQEEDELQMQVEEEEEEPIQMKPIQQPDSQVIHSAISSIQLMIQLQHGHEESDEEGMTLDEIGEVIGNAILSNPPMLASICQDRIAEIERMMSEVPENSRHHNSLNDVWRGFFGLAFQLLQTEGETTEEQRANYLELQERWERIPREIEDDNIARIARDLRRTRSAIERMRSNLVLIYRQVYLSGEDSTTEIVISETNEQTTTLRNISDQITGFLSAINDADAALSGRQVAPVLTALSRANMILNLILGWNFTGDLDSASQEAFDDLQNGLSLGLAVGSFTAAAPLLPLFGHIPVLLGAISQQWDRIVEGLRAQNTDWWEAFGEMPYCSEEPGGCETLHYMESVFRASSFQDVQPPPDEARSFFLGRRDMFDTVAREVMESSGVPTDREYLIFTGIDDDSFPAWLHYNREWVWRLIYGERSFPRNR